MLKSTVLALAAAAAALAFVAPAEAHGYGYVYPTWHYNHVYHQEHEYHTYNTYQVYEHQSSCEWVWQKTQVWSDEGPIWVNKKVQVCN